jgi:hypothetical protein
LFFFCLFFCFVCFGLFCFCFCFLRARVFSRYINDSE